MNLPDDLRLLAEVDRVLHEPARMILAALLYPLDQADFLFLESETGLTRGNLSSHLSKLEAAGYVEVEKTFAGKIPRTLYRLTESGRTAFDRYREQMARAVESLPRPARRKR